MPWKNGGGSTLEVACWPEGAGLAAFDWRVSMATVAADGPFSLFPGIDRTLAVLAGAGLRLAVAGRPPVRLTPAAPPFPFPGDAPAAAALIAGPVLDLNLMIRRSRFAGTLRRRRLVAPATVAGRHPVTILLWDGAACRLEAAAGAALLGRYDALLLAPGERVRLSPGCPGRLWRIAIAPIGRPVTVV